jgi:pimeloyl-ACP methyl ester carboxylesterase
MWHYCETGAGRPLILLHGIGMSHSAWDAVIPRLPPTRRVIAFDIAGFGSTPPLPAGTAPTIVNLVDGLEQSLQEMGIRVPVDMAGTSLGGGMALEAARRGLARTVVAISPIGLWERRPAPHVPYVFASLRFTATTIPRALKALLWNPLLRECALAVPMSVGSRRMPLGDAYRSVDDLAASTAFEDTFECTRAPFFGRDISVPVTVAFGHRDWILTRGSRHRDRLPTAATWIEKDRWGHVPMWADPAGVTQLILDGTRHPLADGLPLERSHRDTSRTSAIVDERECVRAVPGVR